MSSAAKEILESALRLAQAYANRAGASHSLYFYIDSASSGLYYGDI
jgi:sulfur relay (sulfurtransferase) complex TusBCD TusD component (DsrE family)